MYTVRHYDIFSQIRQPVAKITDEHTSQIEIPIQNPAILVQCSKCFKARTRVLRIANRRLFQGKVYLGLASAHWCFHLPEGYFAFFYWNCLENEVNAGLLVEKLDQRHMEGKMHLYIKTAKNRVLSVLRHTEYMIFGAASRCIHQMAIPSVVYAYILINSNSLGVSIQRSTIIGNCDASLESEATR